MIKEIPAKTVYICDRCNKEYSNDLDGIDIQLTRTGSNLFSNLNFCPACTFKFHAWKNETRKMVRE